MMRTLLPHRKILVLSLTDWKDAVGRRLGEQGQQAISQGGINIRLRRGVLWHLIRMT
jgi:hypothetical protein